MSEPVVLCLGHHLRGDDALGPVVADRLRARGINARWLLGDAADLLGAWTPGDDVILVDAVVTGAKPGTLHKWNGLEVPLERVQSCESTHGFGVAEAISLGRALGRLPRRLTLIGVEAASFEFDAPLSPEVEAALDGLVQLTIEEWTTYLTAVGA